MPRSLSRTAQARYRRLSTGFPGPLAGEWLEPRRLLSGGSLVAGFGTAGLLSIDPAGASGAAASSIAVQSDGKIVQAGVANDATSGKADITLVRYNANGTLDTTFGTNGVVFTPLTTGSDAASVGQVLIDSHGRIVVVGGDGKDFVVARYTAAGALDTSFGSGGITVTPVQGSSATGKADQAAFDATGAIIVGGDGFSLNQGFFAPIFRYESNGVLDPTFGINGMAFANAQDVDYTKQITSLVVEDTGSILIGGNSNQNTDDWLLMRFTANGQFDPTWGGNGVVDTNVGSKGQETAYGLAEQPDGKVVVVGDASVFAAGGYDVARYNADGTLDTTFGTGGIVNTVLPNVASGQHANSLAVAVLSDGEILVGGASTDGQGDLAEYQSNGSLDTSFGNGGTAATVITSFSSAFGSDVTMALDSTGRIFLGSPGFGGPGFQVACFLGNSPAVSVPATSPVFPVLNAGQADATFGWSGYDESFPGSGGVDTANDVAVQADGKVVQVGSVTDADGKAAFGLARYNIDGSLDPTFGTAGVTDTPITSGSSVVCNGVTVQPDGKIVAVGGDGTNLVVVRYLANGSLDTSFGSGGIDVVPVPPAYTSGGNWQGERVAIDATGRIIVAGKGFSVAHTTGFFGFVTRLSATGAFDTSYGTSGITLLNFGASGSITDVTSMIIETGASNQDVVVTGALSGDNWGVARLTANGAKDGTFGNDVVATSFGKSGEIASGVAEQSNGDLVVVGYSTSNNGGFDVARYTSTGKLDTTFAGTGTLTTLIPNSTSSYGLNIGVEPDGNIIASGTAALTGGTAMALVQYTSTGTLDSNFGTAGVGLGLVGGVNSTDTTMALAPDGKIVLASGGQIVPGDGVFDFNAARFDEDSNTGVIIAPAAAVVSPSSSTTETFNVTLGQAATKAVTVQYQTEDNTATAGTDYTAASGTLTFSPGVTAATIMVPVARNSSIGSDKTFFVNLSNPSGASLSVGEAVGRIDNQNASQSQTASGWTNPANPLDVNGDGNVTANDAIIVINYLNTNGPGKLPTPPAGSHSYYDTNDDRAATPVDALIIINHLNAAAAAAKAAPAIASITSPSVALPQSKSAQSTLTFSEEPQATKLAASAPQGAIQWNALANASPAAPVATATSLPAAQQAARSLVLASRNFDPKSDVDDLLHSIA